METFGRELTGVRDALPKYELAELLITDQEVIKTSGKRVHPILRFTGGEGNLVEGTIFEITSFELTEADKYEVDDYVRKKLQFRSGIYAWGYVAAEGEQAE